MGEGNLSQGSKEVALVNYIISHSIASFLAILLSVVFYVNSLKLPPAAYQLPRLLCGIIVFLSILMLYEAILEERMIRKGDVKSKASEEREETYSIDYKRQPRTILL